jgi:hypothetical protein
VTAAMPDPKARAQAFWAEVFNAHELGKIRGFLAPGFVNHNARPGTPDGPEGAGQVFSRLWAGCSTASPQRTGPPPRGRSTY